MKENVEKMSRMMRATGQSGDNVARDEDTEHGEEDFEGAPMQGCSRRPPFGISRKYVTDGEK